MPETVNSEECPYWWNP